MKHIIFSAILATLLFSNAFAGSPSVTVTVTTSPPAASYTNGPLTLYATVSSGAVDLVTYYASQTAGDGTVTTTGIGSATFSPYQVTWTPPAGTYSIFAIATVSAHGGTGTPSPTSTGTTNGTIDLVGAGSSVFPSNVPNPVQYTTFGEPPYTSPSSPSTLPWKEGDNQMCSTSAGFPNWPYNGSNVAYPDGSCEWSNSAFLNPPITAPQGSYQTVMTLDGLDDAEHTLSDFDKYATSILGKNVGTLSQTFSTWYAGAAKWIAPVCSACTVHGSTCENKTCNSGTVNGRLLNYYEPDGYPGIPEPANIVTNYSGATVDKFKDWNNLITSWLENSYASSTYNSYGAWCVPLESTLETQVSSSMCASGKVCPESGVCPGGSQCIPSEISFIDANSGTNVWGDLSHVIACLNYNAGPTAAQQSSSRYANYQTCLSELPSGASCPTALPPDCPPFFDPLNGGCDITVVGGYASWLSNNPNQAPNSVFQQCLTALTSAVSSGGGCPSTLPAECAPLGSPPKAWSSTDTTRCDPFTLHSYANWAQDSFNWGPVYNYQNCLNLLTTKCPADGSLAGTVCDASVLGRALESGAPAFSGTSRCIPSAVGSYAHWLQDNITLFTDETPKFVLRSSFLTDINNRARTMQSTLTQGDEGLHSFLKPCDQCAYISACPSSGVCADGSTLCGPPSCADGSICSNGQCTDGTPCLPAGQCANVSACPSGGKCADGSLCGPPKCKDGNACEASGLCSDGLTRCNYCANGGPAAQLIFERTQPSPTDSLPNAVIYGWQDSVPTGRVGACTDTNGNAVGCSHIVKVTAYSAARVGNGMSNFSGLQTQLPNIYNWSTFFYDYFTLQQRDGNVYISVKRWDQDHSNSVAFPNGHALWQYIFHNPTTRTSLGASGLPSICMSVPLSGTGTCTSGNCLGYGLQQQTIKGLQFGSTPISSQDISALSSAFMLNDNGNGLVDPYAKTSDGKPCTTTGSPNNYCACLDAANKLLNSGTESHACARYIASSPASDAGSVISGNSQTTDADYSLKFINCNAYDNGQPPEDLTY